MKISYVVAGAVVVAALAAGGIAVAVGGGSGDGADTAPERGPFVGQTAAEAAALAEADGRPWRIAREDTEDFVLTGDLVAGRVTFEIDQGIVTSAVVEEPSVPSADDGVAEDTARADLVAAAVARILMVDNSFGGSDVFADIRVAGTMGDELERIAAALPGTKTVRHIEDADAEIGTLFDESPAGVAVVSVERVLLGDDRAEVELRLWCGSLCGVFLTYEAIPADGGWSITGTTGPIAVS